MVTNDDKIRLTKEMFESLDWDDLKEGLVNKSSVMGTAAAKFINALGDVLEEELGTSEKTFARMLILAGCSILAAVKQREMEEANN